VFTPFSILGNIARNFRPVSRRIPHRSCLDQDKFNTGYPDGFSGKSLYCLDELSLDVSTASTTPVTRTYRTRTVRVRVSFRSFCVRDCWGEGKKSAILSQIFFFNFVYVF